MASIFEFILKSRIGGLTTMPPQQIRYINQDSEEFTHVKITGWSTNQQFPQKHVFATFKHSHLLLVERYQQELDLDSFEIAFFAL